MDRSIQNVAEPETESIWTIEVKQNYFRLWCNNKLSFFEEYKNISSDCENRMRMEPVKIMLVGTLDDGTLGYQVAPGNNCLIPKPSYLFVIKYLLSWQCFHVKNVKLYFLWINFIYPHTSTSSYNI